MTTLTSTPRHARVPSPNGVPRHLEPRLGMPTHRAAWPPAVPLPVGIDGVTYQQHGGVHINGLPLSGRRRHLSHLLAAPSARPPARAQLYQALHTNGVDPVLYDAYRDILPPQPAAGSADGWFTDLVVYQPGTLPNGEPVRSIGHWNTPTQLEIFQCLTGRILMLVAGIRPDGSHFCQQHLCTADDPVVVPFGAWHLTYVLDGPAAVINIYADHPGGNRSSRDAALHPAVKYGPQEPVELAVRRCVFGLEVVGTRRALRAWGQAQRGWPPRFLQRFLGPGQTLGDLMMDADDTQLATLMSTAWGNR